MLQDYHRQTKIKPFAPILKDRSIKRWNSEISLPTNISLLSISKSSIHSHDDEDDKIDTNQNLNDIDSSSSRESFSIVNESEEFKAKHSTIDTYILNKHLHAIPSTISNLADNHIDECIYELFDESKLSYRFDNEEYNPRSIRPPAFSQHIKQIIESRKKPKPTQCRSARIPVRTTKAEQLKLARQQSASLSISNLPNVRPSTTKSQPTLSSKSRIQSTAIISANRLLQLQANDSSASFRQSESARSCKIAIGSNDPLLLSSMLVRQMRQDIQSNRVPSYSKPLNSALLHEQPHPPLSNQYKMRRIHDWLKSVTSSDYIEYNEYASNESIRGTNFNDKMDLESDIFTDEKTLNNIERTSDEAHRVLPLFKTAINRHMQQRNLLLTRIELDLYAI